MGCIVVTKDDFPFQFRDDIEDCYQIYCFLGFDFGVYLALPANTFYHLSESGKLLHLLVQF